MPKNDTSPLLANVWPSSEVTTSNWTTHLTLVDENQLNMRIDREDGQKYKIILSPFSIHSFYLTSWGFGATWHYRKEQRKLPSNCSLTFCSRSLTIAQDRSRSLTIAQQGHQPQVMGSLRRHSNTEQKAWPPSDEECGQCWWDWRNLVCSGWTKQSTKTSIEPRYFAYMRLLNWRTYSTRASQIFT